MSDTLVEQVRLWKRKNGVCDALVFSALQSVRDWNGAGSPTPTSASSWSSRPGARLSQPSTSTLRRWGVWSSIFTKMMQSLNTSYVLMFEKKKIMQICSYVFRFLVCSGCSTWPAWLASSPPPLCCSSSVCPVTARVSCYLQLTSAWPTHRTVTSAQKLRQQPSTSPVALWRTRVWTAKRDHPERLAYRLRLGRLHIPLIRVSGGHSSLHSVMCIVSQILIWK